MYIRDGIVQMLLLDVLMGWNYCLKKSSQYQVIFCSVTGFLRSSKLSLLSSLLVGKAYSSLEKFNRISFMFRSRGRGTATGGQTFETIKCSIFVGHRIGRRRKCQVIKHVNRA